MTVRRGEGRPAGQSRSSSTADRIDGERLLADAVSVLHANGAGSARSIARAAQIESRLGLTGRVELGWNESTILLDRPADAPSAQHISITPSAVGMNRVLAVDAAINRFVAGDSTAAEAHDDVRRAAALPPSNVFLFAAAGALGASCLALLFGVSHWQTVIVIAVSAAAGAFLRRGIGALGGNNFWQVGIAALLAGFIGAIATNADISSSLRLVAVCPCMILVPGPHLLNGSLDVAALRIPLGIARLTFAALTLFAIGAGLIAGLTLGGASLVVDPVGRDIPLWIDAAAAGLVAVCYGIFYSAPLRILVWPLVVGAAVHALHWFALEVWQLPSYLGAGLACAAAASVLLPVSRRMQLPFSAIGFASVVSLMPGVLIFRALAGLSQLQTVDEAHAQQLLLVSTVDDASVAVLTIFAMAVGFILPAGVYGMLEQRHLRARRGTA